MKEISKTRKDFYKRLIYIGLCVIPIVLFAESKGIFRLVPLPFFLIGMYQLIQIIGNSPMIVDDFFPPRVEEEKTVKPFDKFMYYFSSILFFMGLVALIFEIKKFDNTINGTRLFWTSGVVGIGHAIAVTIILKLTHPSVYYESKRRFVVYSGLFIGLFLTATALAGFINHHFADPTPYCKKYKIEQKSISGSRSKEYFFFISVDHHTEERFSVGKKRYDDFSEREEIELCILRGRLGFDYVIAFNKVTTSRQNY